MEYYDVIKSQKSINITNKKKYLKKRQKIVSRLYNNIDKTKLLYLCPRIGCNRPQCSICGKDEKIYNRKLNRRKIKIESIKYKLFY
jgi:hypothetical protein